MNDRMSKGAVSLVGLLVCAGFFGGVTRGEAQDGARELPEGVKPLPAQLRKRLDQLQTEAARYRGLTLKNAVRMGVRDEPSLKKRMVEMFEEELPPKLIEPMQQSLKNFDLIPREMDLKEYYPKLLTSQVAGYYDPKAKYLVLVDREGGLLGEIFAEKFSPMVVQRMEESTLVHELTHAIQDQHYDLQKFGQDTPLSDAAVAKLALIEGDAMVVTYSFMLQVGIERVPTLGATMKLMDEDPEQMLTLMPDMPGAKELMEAPAFIRENLLFSYVQGMGFCVEVLKHGGQKLLHYAFTKDPPRSSEQIMHPGKWVGKRDDPILLTIPDLSTDLAGYEKRFSGSWGEFNTRLLLLEKLGKDARGACSEAAEGWGGDAFALYAKGADEITVWVTEWDSVADAGEFFELAGRALGKEWDLSRAGTTRVTLVRGKRTPGPLAALHATLAKAEAKVPANIALDLVQLGITQKDVPQALSLAEMQKMATDPFMQEMMKGALSGKDGKVDLAKWLDHPQVGEMVDKMAKEMLGDAGAGIDFKELMKNPMVGKMLEQMLAGDEATPKGRTEAGVYTNPERGFRIKAPKAEGWKINDKPAKSTLGPAPIVELTSADQAAKVMLVEQKLPLVMPIEQMGPMLELGVKMPMKNYKRVKGGAVKVGSQNGYELEYTGEAMGAAVHMLQRYFIIDGRLLVLMGTSSMEDWDKHKDAVVESVGSFSFVEKAPAPAKEPDTLKPSEQEGEKLEE